MLISSLRALHRSALSLEVWAKAAGVIITQGSQPCQGAACVKAWEQRGQAAADAVPPPHPPVPGKVLMQNKCIYHFQPLRSQGRASCLRVECQLAVGTVAGGQRKFHSSPRFLPLRRVLQAQQQAVQRPACPPALETRAPGSSQTLWSPASQPCHSGLDAETL